MTREHRAWEMLIRRLDYLNSFAGNRSEMERTMRIVEQIWDDAEHEEKPEDPDFYPVENIGFDNWGGGVMDKTEMMKRYEAETGRKPKDLFMGSEESLIHFTREYVEWLEAKASAYDRLMGGEMSTTKHVIIEHTNESPYPIPYGQLYCPICNGQTDTGFRCMGCGRQFSPPMEQEVLDGRM
jgi:hypothetical protein